MPGATLHLSVWIANLLALCALAPDSIAVPASAPRIESGSALEKEQPRSPRVADSTRPPPRIAPLPYTAPDWSWEIAPFAGALAVDFPQRSGFASDLNLLATRDSLVVRQPFPGSDLAWTAGMDFVLRRRDDFRLVFGGGWTGWSAQAIAGRRDSLVRALSGDSLVHRSYSSDLLTGQIGLDLLIPRRILSMSGARDAFFGVRLRAGIGFLDGASSARGLCLGESFLLGSDVAAWKRWALTGALAWNSVSTSSSSRWSRVLWNSADNGKVSWDGGGLSLLFQLRWGPGRDSSALAESAQRK